VILESTRPPLFFCRTASFLCLASQVLSLNRLAASGFVSKSCTSTGVFSQRSSVPFPLEGAGGGMGSPPPGLLHIRYFSFGQRRLFFPFLLFYSSSFVFFDLFFRSPPCWPLPVGDPCWSRKSPRGPSPLRISLACLFCYL